MNKCVARVSDDHGWRSHQCSRNGKVQRGVDWYCAVHDPEARRERENTAQLKYTAETNYKVARSKVVYEAVNWAASRQDEKLIQAVTAFLEATEECVRNAIPGYKLL